MKEEKKEEIKPLRAGTPIVMTRGYQNIRGVVVERANSHYEFYMIHLDNGLRLVAGPSAFMVPEESPGICVGK